MIVVLAVSAASGLTGILIVALALVELIGVMLLPDICGSLCLCFAGSLQNLKAGCSYLCVGVEDQIMRSRTTASKENTKNVEHDKALDKELMLDIITLCRTKCTNVGLYL